MSTEKFCLKWNDFESNISSAFKDIRDEKDFFDVTLACDDDQLQAHKVILSACSPFFRNVLKRNPHQHPLLYLKGVKYTDLQSVLNFMYHGEVNVAQDELNSFLAVAEELRVKGLTQNNAAGGGGGKSSHSAPKSPPPSKPVASRPRSPAPPPKRQRPNPPPVSAPPPPPPAIDDDDIQEVVPVKSEPRDPAPAANNAVIPNPHQDMYDNSSNQQTLALAEDDYGQDESYDDYGQYGDQDAGYDGQMMDPTLAAGADGNKGEIRALEDFDEYIRKDGPWNICTICQKMRNKTITNVRCHIESKHFPGIFSYSCEYCGKLSFSKTSFRDHTAQCRRKAEFQ